MALSEVGCYHLRLGTGWQVLFDFPQQVIVRKDLMNPSPSCTELDSKCFELAVRSTPQVIFQIVNRKYSWACTPRVNFIYVSIWPT